MSWSLVVVCLWRKCIVTKLWKLVFVRCPCSLVLYMPPEMSSLLHYITLWQPSDAKTFNDDICLAFQHFLITFSYWLTTCLKSKLFPRVLPLFYHSEKTLRSILNAHCILSMLPVCIRLVTMFSVSEEHATIRPTALSRLQLRFENG